MLHLRLGLTVILVTLALGGGPARSAEPVRVRVAYIAPPSLALMMLERKDLTRHLGQSYTLEPVRYAGSPLMITALANGELQVADLAFSTIAIAVQNAGMDDLRVIADDLQDGAGGYYSDEFMTLAAGSIKTIEDLKGKVVATNASGSAVDITVRAMLRRHGLEDKRDYSIVEAPFSAMRAMLAERKVDLVPAVLPFSVDPELRNIGRTLFNQKDALGLTQLLAWAARRPFLDRNRAAMLDLLEDRLRVLRWCLDHANGSQVREITARLMGQPAEQLGWVFTKQDYYRDPDMIPALDALQKNINLTKDLGYVKATIDLRNYTDLSLAKEAVERLR